MSRVSQVAPAVKYLPANAGDTDTRVPSLGQEDPLVKGMDTHSSILAWRIPWAEEPGWATVHGIAELDTTKVIEHTCKDVRCEQRDVNSQGGGSGRWVMHASQEQGWGFPSWLHKFPLESHLNFAELQFLYLLLEDDDFFLSRQLGWPNEIMNVSLLHSPSPPHTHLAK